jgi:spermidine synthase
MEGRAVKPRVPVWLLWATTCSGAAALIYETVWARALSNILGSTMEASSAVFAAFLTGLALGAAAFGRRSGQLVRPLRAYLLLELGIGASACVTGWALHTQSDRLAAVLSIGATSWRAASAYAVTLLFVLVPTVLMGATFPLVLTIARRVAQGAPAIGIVYGYNTFGAALGTIGAGFVFLGRAGVTGTLGIAALLNLACAIFVVPHLRREQDEPPVPEAQEPAMFEAAPGPALPQGLLLTVAAASGAMVLALELIWMRFAGFFLGNRTYAFSALLACVLLMLACGSWLSTWLLRRFEGRMRSTLGWLLLAAAAVTLLGAAVMVWWIPHQTRIEAALPHARQLLLVYRLLEVGVLTGPPLLLLGALFPASLILSRAAGSQTGQAAGRFYLVNTMGAVTGSLGAGFYGLAQWGAYGCAAAVVAAACLLSAAVLIGPRGGLERSSVIGLALAAVLLALVPSLFSAQLSVFTKGETPLFRKEDRYGVLQVVKRPDGRLKVTNNRTELVFLLGGLETSYVQQMQGHLGMFFRPWAKTAAVLGSGYGITAGTLGLYPQLEKIDAVEILPGMIEAADLFVPFNFSYHHHPRIELIADDARHFLSGGKRTYDIISVNVTDPRIPGISALFHADFYAVTRQHLNEHGIVIQHAFGPQLKVVMTTLGHSFKYLRLMPSYGNGFNVIASDSPLEVDPLQMDALLKIPAVSQALGEIGLLPPLELRTLFEHLDRPEDHPDLFGGPESIATDDLPLLEFAPGRDGADLLFTND